MRSVIIIALLLVVCLFSFSSAMYFEVKEGEERCFVEEVPIDTHVSVTYKSLDYDVTQIGGPQYPNGIVIYLFIRSPDMRIILEHDTEQESKVSFTSQTSGVHTICLKTETGVWQGVRRTFRFELKSSYGEESEDYSAIAKAEHLSAIELEIRKLVDRVKDVHGELEYQKRREEAFRDTSESTNSRVMWWSLFQTALQVIVGVASVTLLSGFFKRKKLA